MKLKLSVNTAQKNIFICIEIYLPFIVFSYFPSIYSQITCHFASNVLIGVPIVTFYSSVCWFRAMHIQYEVIYQLGKVHIHIFDVQIFLIWCVKNLFPVDSIKNILEVMFASPSVWFLQGQFCSCLTLKAKYIYRILHRNLLIC